jgi:hypothetical protein
MSHPAKGEEDRDVLPSAFCLRPVPVLLLPLEAILIVEANATPPLGGLARTARNWEVGEEAFGSISFGDGKHWVRNDFIRQRE